MCLRKERGAQAKMDRIARDLITSHPRVVAVPTPESIERHRVETDRLRSEQEKNYANNPSCIARKNWWDK